MSSKWFPLSPYLQGVPLFTLLLMKQSKGHSLYTPCLASFPLFEIPSHLHISQPTWYLFLLSSWHLINASRCTIPHNSLSLGLFSCQVHTCNKFHETIFTVCIVLWYFSFYFILKILLKSIKQSDLMAPLMDHGPEFKNNKPDHKILGLLLPLHPLQGIQQTAIHLLHWAEKSANSEIWVSNRIDWKGRGVRIAQTWW